MSDEPDLTVVTVTYSPGSHLDRFLSSLTVATDRPVRVVIADNGSTDGTPEGAPRRPESDRAVLADIVERIETLVEEAPA